MAFNLLDSVKGLFNSDLIGKAASSLGENEGGVAKAISGIVPAVLGVIVSKGASSMEGASSVLDMAKGAAATGLPSNLGNLFDSGSNSSLLSNGLNLAKRVLGDRLDDVTGLISNFAGVGRGAISSLLGMITPVALGILGKHATENNMNPSALSNMLSSQKSSIMDALPAGLGSLASLTGLSAVGSALSSATGSVRQAASSTARAGAHAIEGAKSNTRWLWPLLLAILGVILVWLFARSCNSNTTRNTVAATDTTTEAVTMPARTEMVSIKVKLPDGTELDAYRGGIEDMLVSYLNSGDAIDKNRWFDFDNLNFKTGSADLTDESMKQVGNIAAILKAYPKVTIKIGGYTDKTGNEESNMKLSQQRAETVAGAVKTAGANGSQLTGAEGYGSQLAKAAPDAPDEERVKDRRISVNVRSK